MQGGVVTGKGRKQDNQRRLWQVEVRQQRVEHFVLEARRDKELGSVEEWLNAIGFRCLSRALQRTY